MKTLKAKTVVILSLLLVLCVVASGIVACKTYKNDGTYYYYSNGNYNKNNYFKLQKDTWTNDAGESGKCKVEGNNVTLYIDFFGSQQIHASGIISDDVMCIAFMGDNYIYYCKEGKKPSSDTPDPKPNPSGETYTVTFDLNGGNGKQDSMKFEKGKVMSNLPVPTRNGYNFICWEDNFGTEYTAASVMPARNLSLTAKWQKIITNYTDDYVSLKPASQGVKDPSVKLLSG